MVNEAQGYFDTDFPSENNNPIVILLLSFFFWGK
jgi:hypothetical protein